MKKKCVAFCLRDMQLGGVESVLVRTLDDLSRDKNFDITVVSFVDIAEPQWVDWFRNHPNIKHIVLYPSKYFGTRMPRFFLWRVIKHACRDIYRFCLRGRAIRYLSNFDTVVDYHDFGFYAEFKKLSAPKKIAWFHSSINVFVRRKFVNQLNVYDNVVVLTDDCANELKTLYPQYADKFVRLYNPIEAENIKLKSTEKCPVRGEYFCSVARMSYDKDIKTLLNAFDIFWKKHKSVKLVLVGGGDKQEVFEKHADTLASRKNILFVGAQKNPYPYIKNAVANILSSYGEGFALVLVESQILGVLNIASNCKYGPREILLNGAGGLLFVPGDVNALAKHMINVYENATDVKKMITQSTRELKRFNKTEIVRQIKSLIS